MNGQLAPRRGRHAAPETSEFDPQEAVTTPLPVWGALAPAPETTMVPGGGARATGSSWKRRGTFAAASVAVLAAATGGAFVLGTHTPAGTSGASTPAVSPVPGAAVTAPVHATPVAAPASTKPVSPHKTTVTGTSKSTARATATAHRASRRYSSDTAAGCGQRAVMAGVFNPACSEFQGYLDPGVSAGRAPNDADIQNAWMNCTAIKTDAECRRELD